MTQDLAATVAELRAENERLRDELNREEQLHSNTIDHRDQHEARLNKIFDALGMEESDAAWTSHNDPSDRAVEYIERLADAQPCGHHVSLLSKSVESDYTFCQLCEARHMMRDSETAWKATIAERDLLQSRLAELAAENERLKSNAKEIATRLTEIVITEGEDAGVVLLSQDGTTHYDESVKGQVYDHNYFSPLGDALMNLWRLASTEVHADDPEFDATDAAHPAWWRGHYHTTDVLCREIHEILDGKPHCGIAAEPWESVRKRLTAIAAKLRKDGV